MKQVKLNVRQEQFVQEIAKGKTQRQAYLLAYPGSKKWKPETVDSKSSVLANNGKVLARLEEIQREIERRNSVSREAVIEQLRALGFADIPVRNVRASDKLKALEIIVRILGYDKHGSNEITEASKAAHANLVSAIKELSRAGQ